MTEFRPTRPEILPQVIKNLLIINVLFFIAQITIGESGYFSIEDNLALHHVRSPLFKPWQIVTHLFLHGSWGHLLGNMFALWMFGSILENLWGPKRFLTFYFLCGIGAALLHLAFLWYDYHGLLNDFAYLKLHLSPGNLYNYCNAHQDKAGLLDQTAIDMVNRSLGDPGNNNHLEEAFSYINRRTDRVISFPTLGASGAVFGVLAAFVYLFPNDYIYLYLLVPIKAKWLGLAYFGFEIFMALQNSAGDNVARWAHIGGGIVGFLLVITWNKNRRRFY